MLTDITLGQYYPGDSFLHRMDPVSYTHLFPGKCTKIPAGLLSQEIAGIFSMKKDMTQISCHIFCFR